MLDNWFKVAIHHMSLEKIDDIIDWLEKQNLIESNDFFFIPESGNLAASIDVFCFKDSSVATLFKLTFGGS